MATHLALATAPKERQTPEPRLKRVGFVLALVAAGLLLVAAWGWSRSAEQRAIRHLPVEERRALYDRTLRTLQAPCRHGKRANGLESFCREQAEFILQFPECDAACSARAREHLSGPSR